MKNKALKLSAILLAVGLIVAIVAGILSCIVWTPAVTAHDFPYAVTYTLDGETKTLEGVFSCRFTHTEALERYYEGTFRDNPTERYPGSHAIAQKDDLTLCIVIRLTDYYLMGDLASEKYSAEMAIPYLAVFDAENIEYMDEETVGQFDAGLVSWELPQPIKNKFVPNGFAGLNALSMAVMLGAGLLTLLAVMIAVRRDKTVPYKALDKVSVVLNFIVCLAVLPFMTVVVWLMEIVASNDEIVYMIDLCIPALTAFTVAASVALRRKAFTKSGFFIQFAGPVLFALLAVLEAVLLV